MNYILIRGATEKLQRGGREPYRFTSWCHKLDVNLMIQEVFSLVSLEQELRSQAARSPALELPVQINWVGFMFNNFFGVDYHQGARVQWSPASYALSIS